MKTTQNPFLKTCLLYLTASSFILGWWFFAFSASYSPLPSSLKETPPLRLTTATLLNTLSPLQRQDLHQALAGDYALMLQLIAAWDKEAHALLAQGFENIQLLTSDKRLQVKILGQLIQHSSPSLLRELNCQMNVKDLPDDKGQLHAIKEHFKRFLPQTYVAASFLLALASPNEIAALPRGLRQLPQLYSPLLLDAIPLNMDQLSSEKIFLDPPQLAFVAPYSHPPVLDRLRKQGLSLYHLYQLNSVEQIQKALLKVGHATHHRIEAQLLALFMEASFLTIDNRLHLLYTQRPSISPPCRLLCLSYHQHYSLPTTKCLTGQLLTRALHHYPVFTCLIPDKQNAWRVPFEQEKIMEFKPDCLIISLPKTISYSALFTYSPALQHLEAFKNHCIYPVDEAVQDSPTQYIVLAYFDLFQALAAATCL